MSAVEIECGICGDAEVGPWLVRIEGTIVCESCNDTLRLVIEAGGAA